LISAAWAFEKVVIQELFQMKAVQHACHQELNIEKCCINRLFLLLLLSPALMIAKGNFFSKYK
jgi:hypothetical protein